MRGDGCTYSLKVNIFCLPVCLSAYPSVCSCPRRWPQLVDVTYDTFSAIFCLTIMSDSPQKGLIGLQVMDSQSCYTLVNFVCVPCCPGKINMTLQELRLKWGKLHLCQKPGSPFLVVSYLILRYSELPLTRILDNVPIPQAMLGTPSPLKTRIPIG